MGGGPVRTMNMLVWGVDLVEEQLLCSAGIPSNPPVALKPLMNIAEYSVNAMKTGVLKSNDHLEKYQDDKDVLYARPLIEPGTKVVSAKDGLPTWICELMITKPTVDEAIEFVKRIEADIQDNMVIV
jgi:carnosine synthase